MKSAHLGNRTACPTELHLGLSGSSQVVEMFSQNIFCYIFPLLLNVSILWLLSVLLEKDCVSHRLKQTCFVTVPLRSQICLALWVTALGFDLFSLSLSLSLNIGVEHVLCARYWGCSAQVICSLPLKGSQWTWGCTWGRAACLTPVQHVLRVCTGGPDGLGVLL